MAHIEGIKEIRNDKGGLTHVVIDAHKHPEAIGKLKEMGLVEKTQFEKDCEDAIPVEEFFEELKKRIKNFEWQR